MWVITPSWVKKVGENQLGIKQLLLSVSITGICFVGLLTKTGICFGIILKVFGTCFTRTRDYS